MTLNRALIKSQAKEIIKGRVFILFLIIVVVSILSGGITSIFSVDTETLSNLFENGFDSFSAESLEQSGTTTYFGGFSGVFALVFAPLSVALAGLFLKIIKGERYDLGGEFSYVFKNTFDSNFMQKFLLQLLVGIFTTLWSFLLIVPGIIYHYKVYFTDYIMAENPNLSWQETIELSKKMTNGHKGELFTLDLSFILWDLLNCLTIGILSIYVMPYVKTTQALYYENFKARALQTGELTPQDFMSQSEKMAQSYNNGFGTQNQPYVAPQGQQYQPPVQSQYQPPQEQYQPPVQPQYQPPQEQYQPPVQPQYRPPQEQYQPPVEPQQEESFYTPPADAQKYFENSSDDQLKL